MQSSGFLWGGVGRRKTLGRWDGYGAGDGLFSLTRPSWFLFLNHLSFENTYWRHWNTFFEVSVRQQECYIVEVLGPENNISTSISELGTNGQIRNELYDNAELGTIRSMIFPSYFIYVLCVSGCFSAWTSALKLKLPLLFFLWVTVPCLCFSFCFKSRGASLKQCILSCHFKIPSVKKKKSICSCLPLPSLIFIFEFSLPCSRSI